MQSRHSTDHRLRVWQQRTRENPGANMEKECGGLWQVFGQGFGSRRGFDNTRANMADEELKLRKFHLRFCHGFDCQS